MKTILSLFLITASLFAHTPIMSCFDEGDGTITCEGGFSDGSSAGGVKFLLFDENKKEILNTKLDIQSEINFKKPKGYFTAVFDAGPQHEIYIKSQDINE